MRIKRDQITGAVLVILGIVLMVLISQFKKPITAEYPGPRLMPGIAAIGFGVLGFAFKKFEVPSTPFILGFILGPLAESNYRRGMMRTKGSFIPFLTSPISAVFLGIALIVILAYLLKPLLRKRKAA